MKKRIWWNCTGAPLLTAIEVAAVVAVAAGGGGYLPTFDPFMYSGNYVHHSMALVDLQTQDVLWLEERHCQARDARDPKKLELSLTEALTRLPPVGQAALAETQTAY